MDILKSILHLNTKSFSGNVDNFKKIQKFEKELVEFDKTHISTEELINMIRFYGIPNNDIRVKCWLKLSGAEEKLTEGCLKTYENLVSVSHNNDGLHPMIQKEIALDLHRTYPQYEYFSSTNGPGQKALSNVLSAFAYFDNSIGYVQGLAYIIGLFLLHLPKEEQVFWLFYQLLNEDEGINRNKYGLQGLYQKGMPKYHVTVFEVDQLLCRKVPDLYKYLVVHHKLQMDVCISPFVFTLFSNHLALDSALHVFDMFIAEGFIVIIRLFIGLLNNFKKEIFGLVDPCSVGSFLIDKVRQMSPDDIVTVMFSKKIEQKELDELEKTFYQNL